MIIIRMDAATLSYEHSIVLSEKSEDAERPQQTDYGI